MSSKLVFAALISSVFFLILEPVPGLGQEAYLEQPSSEPKFSARIDLPFANQRIWRGLELNSEAVFQPLVRLNDRGFEVEVKSNMDLTDSRGNKTDLQEWRYRVGLARREPGAEAAISYIYYQYPEGLLPNTPETRKTQEVALETSWGYPLVNSFNAYWDFDQVNGFYLNYSLGYKIKWGILTVFPRVGTGFATDHYQRFYFDSDRNSFLDLEGSLGVELEVVPGVNIVAEGLYYELLTGGLREKRRETAEGDQFFARGGLSLRF